MALLSFVRSYGRYSSLEERYSVIFIIIGHVSSGIIIIQMCEQRLLLLLVMFHET